MISVQHKKLHINFFCVRKIVLFLIMLISIPSFGSKFDWSGGFFKLTSQTPTAKTSISNLGAFQISYRFSLLENVEFGFGYSITFSKFFSGDYGYGPDMGLFYFPFSSAGKTDIRTSTFQFLAQELYRPFVCVQFHSRQFQSIGASYAGFSVGGGLEYWGYHPIGLRVWAKNTQLKGPQLSTASELTLMGGFSWEY